MSWRCIARGCAAALSAAVLAAVALAPDRARAAEDDPVVATVNDSKIRFSDVVDLQRALPEQYRRLPLDALFPALRERLIDLQLVAAKAREENLQDDEAVRRRMERIEDRVIREVYLDRYVEETVTDEMLRDRYQSYKADNPPREEVRARHILVESKAEAETLIDELDGGADFGALARENSIGPSGQRGGDLGYFTRDSMVPEFAEVAFAMEPGETSATPVETEFGWHVIRVEDRRMAAPESFEDVREELRTEAAQELVESLVSELRAGATIERFDADGTPAAE